MFARFYYFLSEKINSFYVFLLEKITVFIIFNQKKYWSYRNAYKSRKAGYNDDEYQNLIIDDDRLLDGAKFHKKNRDLSMVFIVGFYILNILDANIDSHLKQYNVNETLTLRPYIENGSSTKSNSIGFSLNLSF